MGSQHLLDLDRRHVLAGNLQHVGATPIEEIATVRVAASAIAGAEPIAVEARRGGRRIVEIAGEQRDAAFAADDDLADLAVRRGCSVCVVDVDEQPAVA